ncbi:MAG: hypothetical protein EOP47_23730, partial [Sphingobacteriaceae bacterium]
MKKILLGIICLSLIAGCRKDKKKPVITEPEITITEFTLPESSVTLDPYGYSPLAALLKFTSPIGGHTEIEVVGKHGAPSSITQTFTDDGTNHSIPILGLYADYLNTVKVSVIDAKGNRAKSSITIQTGTLPVNIPNYINVDVSVTDVNNVEPGINLVSSFAGPPTTPRTPYMVDHFGDIRWCLNYTRHPQLKDLNYDCGIARLANGNYFFG